MTSEEFMMCKNQYSFCKINAKFRSISVPLPDGALNLTKFFPHLTNCFGPPINVV